MHTIIKLMHTTIKLTHTIRDTNFGQEGWAATRDTKRKFVKSLSFPMGNKRGNTGTHITRF
jgi:hypothetical protein